jgi:hypothetical protein
MSAEALLQVKSPLVKQVVSFFLPLFYKDINLIKNNKSFYSNWINIDKVVAEEKGFVESVLIKLSGDVPYAWLCYKYKDGIVRMIEQKLFPEDIVKIKCGEIKEICFSIGKNPSNQKTPIATVVFKVKNEIEVYNIGLRAKISLPIEEENAVTAED